MTDQSFQQRQLQISFTLGTGAFNSSWANAQSAEGGANTTTLSGLRAKAKIVKAGGRSMSTLQLEVYGMSLSDMNQLSTLGMAVTLLRRNTVSVGASDGNGGFATVFAGTIISAWMDAQSMPDVVFRVEAQTGAFDAVAWLPPTTFSKPTDVVTVISSIAAQMGVAFENDGVKGIMLDSPYYKGSSQQQWMQAAEDAGILAFMDDTLTLVIMPLDGNRGTQVPLISKDTGMVGYPTYTSKGIMVRTVFNPSIGYRSQIKVQSSLTPANGVWTVYSLDHNLDANVPGGQWFSDVGAYNPVNSQPLPG